MAGTSQATAMVSGGVAALKSLKPSANLADIESALTSASGGSSKTVAINGIARPTLRLVSSGYKLMGVTEPPDPIPPSPNPTPNPAIATQGKVCFYPYVNYEGQARCASFNYGKWNNWYKITAKVGSVRVEPVNGSTPTTSAKVTFFHYAVDFNYSVRGVTKSEDIPDTSVLGFWDSGIPHIYGVRIQTP